MTAFPNHPNVIRVGSPVTTGCAVYLTEKSYWEPGSETKDVSERRVVGASRPT